jgi:hypothetical protein
VAASVMLLPKELFLVVATIRPARANRAIDKMNKAIRASMSENPFALLNDFNLTPPTWKFILLFAELEIEYFRKSKYHAIRLEVF